ncbi:MAG: response regulator transcription factor [Pseudomonadota bacterium]
MRILLVEDDLEAADYIVRAFKEAGHVLIHVADGETGKHLAESEEFDIFILDRMLPKLDGLSLLKSVRDSGNNTPALILSALGEVDDRVEGLRSGGDDYLTKPYAFSELLARAEVLGRRVGSADTETKLKVGDLELDRLSHTVHRDGEKILLQPREFRLLAYFMQNADRVVTRTMLLEKVWDYHFDPQTNVVDVHISRLRSKIDRDFDNPMLLTVRGAGYKLSSSGAD